MFEKILELIRNEFEPQVFEIFVRNTIEGDSPKLLASQFGITIGNIYKIKFRVLKRLRKAAEGLLDGPSLSGKSDPEIR